MTDEERFPVTAWQAAVASGGTLLSYEEWVEEKTQDEAEQDSLDDEPVEREYGVRLWATFRACAETTVTATSFGEAVKKAGALELTGLPLNFSFSIPSGDDPEGDETVNVFGPDDADKYTEDPWEGAGFEVDRRKEGEPFSWDACAIVKDMAKLHGMAWESHSILSLINRAKAACTKSA